MDPVSAAASIIAVLQITASVITTCNEFRLSVKQAPKEAEQITSELGSLKLVLEQLLVVAEREEQSRPNESFSLAKLTRPDGELDTCRASLVELQKKLEPKEGWGRVKTALTWHFKEGELRKTLDILGKSKDTLNLAVTADTAIVSLGIQDDVAALAASFKAVTLDANQQKAIDWMGAPDSSENQNAARGKHQAKTGDWFLTGTEFENWKTKPKSLLWSHGIPGCGKTVLCSSIIQSLNQYRQVTPTIALAYFYFDFNDSNKATVSKLLRSLIAQLATQHPAALTVLQREYTQHSRGRQHPSLSVLSGLLAEIVKLHQEVFVVIDALDECKEREEVLDWIDDFNGSNLQNVHMLLFSRKERDIDEVLSPLVDSQMCIEEAVVDADIRLYVHDRLSRDRKLKKWPADIKDEIEETLMGKAKGMFRWAVCQLDMLCKCNNIVALRKELQSLPKTLDDTYIRILSDIDEHHVGDALKVLQWLCFSARPVLLTEMVDVLAVDNRETFEFNPDLRYTDPRDILTICSSLISVRPRLIERDPWAKKRESVEELRLAHFSVKEFLISDRISKGSRAIFSIQENIASASIAETCLGYLVQFREYSFLTNENISRYPLATYAAKYWSQHARTADRNGISGPYEKLVYKLLSDREICRNWISLWDPDSRTLVQSDLEYVDLKDAIQDKALQKPLYYASVTGLLGVARMVFEDVAQSEDLNEISGYTGTVLQAAAHAGNASLIEFLIDCGANIDTTGGEMGSALEAAAAEDNEEAVLTLLDRGADANLIGGFYGTALQAAAYKGNHRTVSALLNHGADVNTKSPSVHGTALIAAAEGGHEAIMELLLAHGADINAQTSDSDTALYQAANKGPIRTVKLLLAKGADINQQGHYGGTALLSAAMGDNIDIIRLLLEHGADPNIPDNLFGTPLSNAANRGNLEVIRILLNSGADINQYAGDYGTPLSQAACEGKEEIVDFLLASGADATILSGSEGSVLQATMAGQRSKPDKKLRIAQKLINHGASIHAYGGTYGTPLHAAAFEGRLETVEFFVRNGADINARGGLYGTPLEAAASPDRCSIPIVEYLLAQGADVNATSDFYGSPLHAAAQNSYDNPAMAMLLLKHGACVNLICGRNGSALHSAAEEGKVKIARTLLKAGADVEARTRRNGTALTKAARCESEAVVKLLLANGAAVNSRNEDNNDFHEAAYNGLTSSVDAMLQKGVNINAEVGSYGTALQAAAREGHQKTIALLLDKGANVNSKGGDYGSPLQAAAASESLGAVRLLVSRAADIHYKGGQHCTALQAAASAGEYKTIEYLIGLGVDVNVEGGEMGTALQAAANNESRNAVKLLLAAGANAKIQGGEFGNALSAAAAQYMGDETVVKMLLDAGADVNATGGKYGSALQAAADGQNLGIAKILIAAGADVNARGGEYGAPILAAAQSENFEMVKLLLDSGADIHVAGPNGNALYHAASGGNVNTIQLVLDQGVPIDSGTGSRGTALQATIDAGSIKATRLLIERGVDINEQVGWRGTALTKAISNGEEEIIKLLLAVGADVNAQVTDDYNWIGPDDESAIAEEDASVNLFDDTKDKDLDDASVSSAATNGIDNVDTESEASDDSPKVTENALHAALCQDNEAIRQLILSKTTNINAQGCDYGNALQAAIAKCHMGLVRQILSLGADVHAQGGKYGNALQAAAKTGELAKIELILSHGADVNVQGGRYGNALQVAAKSGHAAIVKLLLQKGAKVNATGGKHHTALQGAAFKGHTEVVKLLLSNGADVDIHDDEKGNALQAAATNGQLAVMRTLRRHKPKPQGGTTSENYGNALQAATDGGFKKVLSILILGWPCYREGEIFEKAVKSLLDGGHENLAKFMREAAELAKDDVWGFDWGSV